MADPEKLKSKPVERESVERGGDRQLRPETTFIRRARQEDETERRRLRSQMLRERNRSRRVK